MPTFQVEISGTPYEVDAPDQNSAVMGAQKYANDTTLSFDTAARQAVRGLPIVGGLANKFAAAMDAATQPLLGRGSSAATYEQRYAENYPTEEGRDVAFEQANPITSTALQIAPAIAAAGPIAGTELGATALGMRGTSLGSRAIAGGLSGAALSAADAATRGGDVGTAALAGGTIGAALPGVAQGLGAAYRGVRGALAPAPTASLPGNTVRIAGVEHPITAGELSGDNAAIAAERNRARGTEGPLVQQATQPFYENRQAGISQATQNMQASMSPTGAVHAETPLEAGNIVSGALGSVKQAAQQAVDQAYNVVRANPTVIPADQFTYLARRIKADLTTSTDPVQVSRNATPTASRMLDTLDQWRGVPINKADFLAPSKATGSTMADIDQFRRELSTMKKGALPLNLEDQRAAGRIIGAFDKQINQIAPSPELAAARAAHAQYRQTFFQNGTRDDIGRSIEKIIGNKGAQPAEPAEVARLLYGSPEGNSPRVVERLKGIFGENSPEFASIKQGYLSRIMEPQSGQAWESGKLATQIEKALFETKSAGLTNSILSPAERAELAKLGAYLRQITPKPGAGINYSGTAAPILKHLGGQLPQALMGMFGLHVGGPLGMAAGLAAAPVKQHLGERLALRRAAQSLYGKGPTPPLSPAAAQALRNLSLLPPVLAPQLNGPPAPPVY